jgi:S1-C subfamily serine protease
VNQLFPKTVLLNTKDTSGRPLALGSGFVLKKGYIVTNYHVVEGAGSGLVRRIGDKTIYKKVGIAAKDEFRDLVLKLRD